MAVNLSTLNISLDKFNAESSGTYNIGQMKLSSDGKSVYRANNHKTWTILNRTEISSEEALAVKFAFCKALSNEGLSPEAVNAVKAKLGIPGSALDALKAGNVKPLTAAEVREVIDTYAGQINQKRASAANGAKALKTSADIYRGVDKKELEDRATTRNEINAKSINKLKTGADKAVNNLLDMLQFGEKGGVLSKSGKALAKEILARLGDPAAFTEEKKSIDRRAAHIRFALQDNGNVTARINLDNGNSFSIDTGLDKDGLVNKAAEMLNEMAAFTPQLRVERPRVERPRVETKSDDDEIAKAIDELMTGETETESSHGMMSNEDLLVGLRDVFKALKNAIPDRRRALRNANMEDVVKALLQALNKARPLDDRNTKLVNDVREVFYGNSQVNTDDLLKEISDVLNKKRVNPHDKVDENIRNKVEDDLDENLNINAWFGED